MTRPRVPQPVLDAAHARKAARLARDWAAADRLKDEIEAAGWRVVDRGADFALQPAHPADIEEAERTRYGWSQRVPSRLDEAASAPVSLIIVLVEDPRVERTVAAVHAQLPAGSQVVVVADAPGPDAEAAARRLEAAGQERAAPEGEVDVVWTSARLGPGAALNAGIRRARGEIVALLDGGLEPTGDLLPPLLAALREATVSVAGSGGLAGGDVRDLEPAGPGDVVALDGSCLAVRRSDARGHQLDESFQTRRATAIEWCLRLRDGGPGLPPRRALAVELPLRGAPLTDDPPADERARAARRDRYRLLEALGGRSDLLGGPGVG